MGLTLFANCRASVSNSENKSIPAKWRDLLLVVAGTAHMDGANGVLGLRQRGYRIEQL
jgi:uncharacterized protein YbaP (TraB family)